MKYRCLVFDHDDTVVNSTAVVHWPCFQEYLNDTRPGETISFDDYMRKNFSPGFIEMCTEDYGFSAEELDREVAYWQKYVETRIPDAYHGIKEIMHRHKAEGGIIAVISHSMKANILRDYRHNGLPEPDIIFGWEQPPDRRKPNPWPLLQVMEEFNLNSEEILMIDDLKPGYDMAKEVNVDFAAAGWSNDIPEIELFMRKNSDFYFKTVEELDIFLV